jgi:hypothetical protein
LLVCLFARLLVCLSSKRAAIARNNLEPGGTWASWGSFWRCDKVTIGKDRVGLARWHYWAPIKEGPIRNLPGETCQPPKPQRHWTHPLISFFVDLPANKSIQVKKHVSFHSVYHHQTHSPHG